MENLVGEIITSVYLESDNTSIVFMAESGKSFPFYAEGDCCSESWFSDIIGIHDLLGNLVVEVEEKEEQRDLEGTRQDVDILYGYTLKTMQGRCDINFRNSSNGYYGGSCYSGPVSNFDYATLDNYQKVTEDFHS